MHDHILKHPIGSYDAADSSAMSRQPVRAEGRSLDPAAGAVSVGGSSQPLLLPYFTSVAFARPIIQ